MALAALATLPLLSDAIGSGSILREALLVVVCALFYGGIFLLGARLLRIDELSWLVALLRQRLRDKSGIKLLESHIARSGNLVYTPRIR